LLRSSPLWDATQRMFIVVYRRFGTALQGSSSQRSLLGLDSMPITNSNKEWKIVLYFAHNYTFPYNRINYLKNQIEHNKAHHKANSSANKKKCVTFTYYSPQIRKITNLFKHTDLKIAFKNKNNILQLTKPRNNDKIQNYKLSGIYTLTCKTCKRTYVGQTSRDLKQRYQEHIRYIKSNNPQSAFALHILNNRHEYGTINEIMTLLKAIKHAPSLIPYEQLFIQAHHQQNKLTAEQSPGKHNPLIQLAIDTTGTSHDHRSTTFR